MRQQSAELERYASRQDMPAPTLFRKWIHDELYKGLIPYGAMPVQSRLFITDMEAVLAALSMRTR